MVNIRSFTLHRWAGLLASVWLMVLCITGIFLDHKKDWAFLWDWQWPSALMSDAAAERATAARFSMVKYLDGNWVMCEPTGCQVQQQTSQQAAQPPSWQASRFDDHPSSAMPMIRHLLLWQDSLWLATSHGIWRSVDSGMSFQYYALDSYNVTYLAADKTLYAVLDYSSIVQQTTSNVFLPVEIPSPSIETLPEQVNLSRLSRDLHYGRGFFGQHIDVWINDIAAVLILLLCISGLYMWLWRRKPKKQYANRFTFFLRWHRLLIGPAAILGILYLCITGILLDHSDDLRNEMRTFEFDRAHLTPVYQLSNWQQQITSIAALDTQIFIGTRLGMWAWDNQQLKRIFTGYAWSATRIDTQVYIGGMGAPSAIINAEKTTLVKPVGHMPSDVTAINDKVIWKTHHGLEYSDGQPVTLEAPKSNSLALYFALDALHSGAIFHKQFKWVNDAIALLALVAMLSGLYRFLKWLKARLRVKIRASNKTV